MGRMNLNEVKSNLLASFDGGDISVFNPLDVVLGHRDGLRIIISEGDVAGTVNYLIEQLSEGLATKWQIITNHCWANRLHPQAQAAWEL